MAPEEFINSPFLPLSAPGPQAPGPQEEPQAQRDGREEETAMAVEAEEADRVEGAGPLDLLPGPRGFGHPAGGVDDPGGPDVGRPGDRDPLLDRAHLEDREVLANVGRVAIPDVLGDVHQEVGALDVGPDVAGEDRLVADEDPEAVG